MIYFRASIGNQTERDIIMPQKADSVHDIYTQAQESIKFDFDLG